MVLALSALACASCADGSGAIILGEVLGQAGAGVPGAGGSGPVTAFEVDQGLRAALTVGADRVMGRLGVVDGFFGDPQVRIPLPGRLGELQAQLARVGLSSPLDDLHMRLNRAAESAIPAARDLVVEAVASITLEDAFALLRGGDTAATDFLRGKTEASIAAAFRPFLQSSLDQSGAFATLDRVSATYGLTGLGTQLRDSLIQHGVTYGLNGMYGYLAQEERAIRQDPVKRTSEILRRVFGQAG
jgi:hypothetical protein